MPCSSIARRWIEVESKFGVESASLAQLVRVDLLARHEKRAASASNGLAVIAADLFNTSNNSVLSSPVLRDDREVVNERQYYWPLNQTHPGATNHRKASSRHDVNIGK